MFALTSPVLAIYNAPLIPTPPTTTKAPVATFELTVPEFATRLPVTYSVLLTISVFVYSKLATVRLPPTYKLPAMLAPPHTCNAPVLAVVAAVVGSMLTLLALIQATCWLAPVDPE